MITITPWYYSLIAVIILKDITIIFLFYNKKIEDSYWCFQQKPSLMKNTEKLIVASESFLSILFRASFWYTSRTVFF